MSNRIFSEENSQELYEKINALNLGIMGKSYVVGHQVWEVMQLLIGRCLILEAKIDKLNQGQDNEKNP